MLNLKPIGILHSAKELKFDAPHQPDKNVNERSIIELFPKHNFEQALKDLQGFEYIWLIWWFHKNKNWKPMVMPPRGSAKRRGVFATRSPHRPNPIGLTAVPLLAIKGRKITIGTSDLIDGTPILDIKPYLTSADLFPEAKQGWVGEIENEIKSSPNYQVILSDKAKKQLKWLEEKGLNFMQRASVLLGHDPSPHRTRRISTCHGEKKGLFRMGCGAWRVFFRVKANQVKVEYFEPGYPLSSLKGKASSQQLPNPQHPIPQHKEQLEFLKKFGH